MAKQDGPKLRITASCSDCVYVASTSYAVQGDSGFHVSCTHPKAPEPKRIGDTTWDTPKWCPLFDVALSTLLRNVAIAAKQEADPLSPK